MISLEDEIAIVQFGQGIYSEVELLDQFNKLDTNARQWHIWALSDLLKSLKPTISDYKQALADSSLDETYKPPFALSPVLPDVKIASAMSGEQPINDYKFVLFLFRTAYQRQFEQAKETSAKWWYRDLSDSAVVQSIIIGHQTLVEEIYNHPDFRSEFASIAKLWHAFKTESDPKFQEPASRNQTQVHFFSYDEIVTESLNRRYDKYLHPITLLRRSLEKAFSIQYRLDRNQAGRLVSDVIRKHYQETYDMQLPGNG